MEQLSINILTSINTYHVMNHNSETPNIYTPTDDLNQYINARMVIELTGRIVEISTNKYLVQYSDNYYTIIFNNNVLTAILTNL